MAELRPVDVRGTRAWFHEWDRDPALGKVALVEFDDGTVKIVPINMVRFLDRDGEGP